MPVWLGVKLDPEEKSHIMSHGYWILCFYFFIQLCVHLRWVILPVSSFQEGFPTILRMFLFLCTIKVLSLLLQFPFGWNPLWCLPKDPFKKGKAKGKLLITDVHKDNYSTNSYLKKPKILRLVEMQIFIFSTKELEVLLMRSEIMQLLLKCALFSNLFTGLFQSLNEALCEYLIRT